MFDVEAIRAHFPALKDGAAHFDGPGGSQTPDTVADAMRHAMLSPLANRGVTTRAARNAEEIVGQCRRALGDLLNADPGGVIFGRSMTALTFDLPEPFLRHGAPATRSSCPGWTTTPTSDPGSLPPRERGR